MAYLLRVGASILFAMSAVMLWTSARAGTPGWKYVAGSPDSQCGTAAAVGPVYVAGHNGSSGGYTYYFTHTTSDETTGVIGGTYYSVNDSNGVQGSPVAWSHQSVACTIVDTDDQTCNDAALVDSSAFGSRDIQIPGLVGSGPVCMPTNGVPAGKGCNVTFNRDVSYQLSSGSWVSEGTYSRSTGQGACTIASPATAPVPDTCKNGQPGVVNGVTVCVPFPPNTPTQSTTKNSGSETGSGGTSSRVEDKATTCNAAGACTTTVTVTTTSNTGVSSTTTTVDTRPKSEMCAATPGAKECQGGSAFSGDCTAGFVYDGDAIQGAIAKEVHKQNCLLNATTTESALYAVEAAKTGDQTAVLSGNSTVTVGPSSFDSSDALGGGSCIANRTIVVWGRSVVLPFSDVCPALGYLRAILISVSYLTAAGIVIGRKT